MDDFDSLWPSMSRRWVWTCPYSILPSTSLWTAAAGSKDGSTTACVSSTGAGVSTATVAGCRVSLDGSPQVKKVKQGRKCIQIYSNIRAWQLTKSHVLDQVWFKAHPTCECAKTTKSMTLIFSRLQRWWGRAFCCPIITDVRKNQVCGTWSTSPRTAQKLGRSVIVLVGCGMLRRCSLTIMHQHYPKACSASESIRITHCSTCH